MMNESGVSQRALIELSVVIPVRGPCSTLPLILDRLRTDAECGRIEVIVVRNGPPPHEAIHNPWPGLRIIDLPAPPSPYAARNAGAAQAIGAALAFLDAKCVPSAGWLDNGLSALRNHGGIVAGDIVFTYSSPCPPAAELSDSVIHGQQRASVQRGRAKGGNLLVDRDAWETTGTFIANVRSGEDIGWTQRAVSRGVTLTFSGEASVTYAARPYGPLIRKAARVGSGQYSRFSAATRLVRIFGLIVVPPSPCKLIHAMRATASPSPWLLIKLIWVCWTVQFAQAAGLAAPCQFRDAG